MLKKRGHCNTPAMLSNNTPSQQLTTNQNLHNAITKDHVGPVMPLPNLVGIHTGF